MTGSSHALNERLEFIGLDHRARTTLKQLQPLILRAIGPALDVFYAKVRATPVTQSLFRDDAHVAGAKSGQEKHWAVIASASYTAEYVNAVKRIGQTHARIGLEPRWYIGGYALVLEQLIHAVLQEQWPRFLNLSKAKPEEISDALSSLVKATMLDMDFAISIYLETLEEERVRGEKAREAAKQESEIAVDAIAFALNRLAAKDLTYRMTDDLPEGYRGLRSNFNVAIEQLESAMQSVINATGEISSGSADITQASDELSRRTEQQAASLEETAAALDQITATVQKSAEGASHARQVVTDAETGSKEVAIVVAQAIQAMNDIVGSSQQISQIIGVIDEIAFQTNLLALNAGVEAARAGDAGKGFAVVALEVRALAQRSAEAAKKIKSLISTSTAQVNYGVKLVAETGEALGRMMGQVTEINDIVATIATGAREQATGLAEVNTAINQIDQVTQKNATMVEETTAASDSLARESEQLLCLMDQFQIGVTTENRKLRQALLEVAPHAFTRPAKARA